MLFIAFLTLTIICDSDFKGVYYEDNERTILKKAPSNLDEYEIPSTARIIRGGKMEYGPFYECKEVLKYLSFAKNSELNTIEPYGLASLKVEILNLSSCTNLKELGYSSFRYCELNTLILPPNLTNILSGALCHMSNI